MPSQVLIQIDDRSQVGEARRAAARMAESLAFEETQAGKLALAVTEAATNIVKHAGNGKLLLTPLTRGASVGIEVLALDRGPGIANLSASLRDGYSTAGSMGAGLGALSRLSPSFDVYSQLGRGTALRMELWGTPLTPPADADIELGAVSLPKNGEEVAGDSWRMERSGDYRTVLAVDGLGHGPNAAERHTRQPRLSPLTRQPRLRLSCKFVIERSLRPGVPPGPPPGSKSRKARAALPALVI